MASLSRHHIKYVLGIDIPLNESYQLTESQYKQIIEAQLLYETFLDTVKTFTKDIFDKTITTLTNWKDAALVLRRVLSNENTLISFTNKYFSTFKKQKFFKFTELLDAVGLSSLKNQVIKIIDKITFNLKGWKKFLAGTAIGTIITYIVDNIKNFPKDKLEDWVTQYISEKALGDILSKLTDVKSYLGYLNGIFKTVDAFYKSLAPTIDRFKNDIKLPPKQSEPETEQQPQIESYMEKLQEDNCCSRSISLHETVNRLLISEGLNYHLTNKIDLNESIYRPQSTKFLELFEEARDLYNRDKLQLSEKDSWYFSNTDLGNWGEYNGVKVPLDFPMTIDFLLEVKAKAKKKQPELNKPKRGGAKKFYVYVRKPGGGIKKVSFGDTSGLSAKINNPEARRSFAARHKCSQAKDKTTPKYWSCRLPRYAKLLGLKSNFSGFW